MLKKKLNIFNTPSTLADDSDEKFDNLIPWYMTSLADDTCTHPIDIDS